jgi:hypothetical protein
MASECRQFIRHPSSIPIQFRLGRQHYRRKVRDVSHGGLCFSSDEAVEAGAVILVEITACEPTFHAEGLVRWCRPDGDEFLVGVTFNEQSVRFAVRMVEQLCYIEAYRRRLEEETGEKLDSQQAAARWINKFASRFPQLD